MQHVELPATGFLRIKQIIAPDGVYPVSRSTWYAGIKTGLFPAPVKIGPRASGWRVEQIRRLIANGPGGF